MLPGFRQLRRISAALGVFAACLHGGSVHAASLLDPALRFRTLTTAHFVIYFHQGEDRLAARLADIAEDEWSKVGAALGVVAPRRTHVILADQTELANGWATPVPYDTIFVTAAAPSGSDFLGRTDDWLRLVFTHEFTHIVHLDRSEGWARMFRGAFGRTSMAFPNLWLPVWQIEGLAAWEESAITGEGRLHAGDFRAIEREAARDGQFEKLDRVNGGLTDWPAGLAPYAFGLGFHDYLSQRFGEARFGELAKRTSRTLPFFGSRAFRKVYGESLGNLWRDYTTSVSATNSANPSNPSPRRLTREGFTVLGPRFAASRCVDCPQTIVYSVRNPSGFPALKTTNVDGSQQRELALRYLGSTVGVSSNAIVFDQQQLHRNVGLYSDLYVLDRSTGSIRELTRDQRLQDPDLSPDGGTIVSVRQVAGRGEIVLVRLPPERPQGTSGSLAAAADAGGNRANTYESVLSENDTQFHAPRWSPDGRQLVVERHRLGALSEIVVVDVTTGRVRVVASDPSARIVTPAWRRDGRAIVAAADFDADTFNLYEFDVEGTKRPRALTRTTGGALWPDVSSTGDLIVFVGYTPDGFDLFTIPYVSGPDQFEDGGNRPAEPGEHTAPAEGGYRAGAYAPWATLPPTSWFPAVEVGDELRVGVGANGADVLGRHRYSASATWLAATPAGAVAPSYTVPDWDVTYVYDRWRPTLFASASTHTLFGAGPADESGRPTPATLRSREVEVGVLLPYRRVRSLRRALVSVVRTEDRYTFTTGTAAITRTAPRLGAAASTARQYGYSISPEDGYSVGATAELARKGFGSAADETTATIDGRAYLPGLAANHVLAVRGAAGASSGTEGAQQTFLLGGAAASFDVLDFGREAISLLRGFPTRSFAGTRVALLNVDYRLPLARPQRGVGTWPLLLHTVHAAVFADTGEAWSDRFRSQALKTSAGAELSLNIIAGYSYPFTVAFGGAWGHDAADGSNRSTAYIRIGHAF